MKLIVWPKNISHHVCRNVTVSNMCLFIATHLPLRMKETSIQMFMGLNFFFFFFFFFFFVSSHHGTVANFSLALLVGLMADTNIIACFLFRSAVFRWPDSEYS